MKKLFLIISTLILFNSSTYSMSGDAPDPSNPIFKVNNKEYRPTEPNFTAEIGVLEDATVKQLGELLSEILKIHLQKMLVWLYKEPIKKQQVEQLKQIQTFQSSLQLIDI